MERIIECVPNFSEGRDVAKIQYIADAIAGTGQAVAVGESGVCAESADGCRRTVPGKVRILNVDPGYDANRTVITFVGSPEAVVEAAFRGVRAAAEVIDMRTHKGEHPRSGATDVLPLVPVSGISLEECAAIARALAKRIYDELGIPCYCYEAAAFAPERRNLAWCRKGEYEALPEKLVTEGLRPDFGPIGFTETVARAGAVNVGARNFLIAVNFNLNTDSVAAAKEIAAEIRESGRVVTAADGTKKRIPGKLKGCKAIGWYMEKYGCAQVSMNITDTEAAPLPTVYKEVRKIAEFHGLRVTGTEIIGLTPYQVLKLATDSRG